MPARTVIDGLEFAQAEKELSGQLPLVDLARLQDCLHDAEGGVDFLLKGGHDRRKRLVLHVEVRGLLHLQCQRCLGRLDYPLQIWNSLVLVRQDETVPLGADEPDAPDCLITGPEMDVAELIEEEILLSLPISPRHPDAACSVAANARPTTNEASTFTRLAALKK